MPKEPGRNLENMTFSVIKYDFLQYTIELFKPMSFILDFYGYPPFPAFWAEDPLKTEANISELHQHAWEEERCFYHRIYLLLNKQIFTWKSNASEEQKEFS